MKHIRVTIILSAKGKLHTVSPLFIKNIHMSTKKRAVRGKRFSKGEEMKLLFTWCLQIRIKQKQQRRQLPLHIHKRILVLLIVWRVFLLGMHKNPWHQRTANFKDNPNSKLTLKHWFSPTILTFIPFRLCARSAIKWSNTFLFLLSFYFSCLSSDTHLRSQWWGPKNNEN